MAEYAETLSLIALRRNHRPVRALAALDDLFRRLAQCRAPQEASRTEDCIWDLWMYHPHRSAAEVLELASKDIAGKRYDIAETRLHRLLRHVPDFAEAWHKRATLYYLQGRDDACVPDLRRTLELEPRHFGALCAFAEILLSINQREAAQFVFSRALLLNPHLQRARAVLNGDDV
jgi:Tfp pilus assembly protein PilF